MEVKDFQGPIPYWRFC